MLIVNLTRPTVPDNLDLLRERLRSSVSEDVTIDVRFFQYQSAIREPGIDR